jgi:hypothetical protein
MKRRAIDGVPPLFVANPNRDGETHARELVTLFDWTTCKD